MIPILYDENESAFNTELTTQGIGRLDEAISCVVTESLNGVYELELQYPVDGRYASQLKDSGTISALRPYIVTDQIYGYAYKRYLEPFDIYRYEIDGDILTVNAHHRTYRAAKSVFIGQLSDWSLEGAARNIIANSTPAITAQVLQIGGSIPVINGEFRYDYVKSAREYLLDSEYSLRKIYGVDIWFRENLAYFGTRGADRGAEIRYGKNLTRWNVERDSSACYNAIIPYWKGLDANQQETTVYSNPQMIRAIPVITPVKAQAVDFSSYFASAPTIADLTNTASAYLAEMKPWEPYTHVEIEFIPIENDFEVPIDLGDIVTVYHEPTGLVKEKMRVVEIKYNSILERFDSISLGDVRKGAVVTSNDGLSATRKNMA